MTSHYRSLFDAVCDAVILCDPRTNRIEDANAAALKLYGYSREEMIGMDKLLLSAEPEKTAAAMRDLGSKDSKRILLRWHKRKDGVGFPVEILASVIRVRGRRMILSSARDVSESQKVREELAASERRLRQIVESAGHVFWMTNLDKTQMLYISPNYEQIWGRSCESLYLNPQDWIDAIIPEDRENVLGIAKSRQSEGRYDEVYRIRRADGALRWIRDRAFPVKDADGRIRHVAGMAEDVTEQMRAAKMSSGSPAPRGGGETVLIVEDELLTRRFAARTLDGLGYRTIEAADGREALAILEADRGRGIRLILMDLVIPRLDGDQLGRIAAGMRPDILILYMSGCGEEEGARRGVKPFLSKPFSARELAEGVRRALNDG